MEVRAVPVAMSEKPELWAFMQDYIHELSVYDSFEAVDGVYPYRYFDAYWEEHDSRWPRWAVVDGEHVGFALIRRVETGEMMVAEFYIRPRFRRGGIGLEFARGLLREHPGPWEINEYRANTTAVLFWRKVIGDYRFIEEEYFGDGGQPRVRQLLTVT